MGTAFRCAQKVDDFQFLMLHFANENVLYNETTYNMVPIEKIRFQAVAAMQKFLKIHENLHIPDNSSFGSA